MNIDPHEHIVAGFAYLDGKGIPIPPDIILAARQKGIRTTTKAAGDLAEVNKTYHDAITAALTTYFEGGNVTGPRNSFRVSATEAFYDAFYLGWANGDGELPVDEDPLAWLEARINQEYGFIDQLFAQIKDLRKDEEFDYFAFVTAKADGYTGTLAAVYNQALLYAKKNQMLTFDGDDGDPNHICQSINGTCVRLKGQRHRASWWLARDLMPYPGNSNFDCGAWRCRHYLRDDDGNRVTV